MQINKEADFVLKGNKVLHPPVRTDGLELYYDTKGKKNTDTYKNKLLDMSGNDRHGELHDFSYKNLSGYQEDSELVFDGIDDKLVLGDVEKPEIISGTKNLFPDSNNWGENLAWDSNGETTYTPGRSVLLDYISIQKGVTALYISGISLSAQYNRFLIVFYDENKNFISNSSRVSTKIDSERGGELLTVPSNAELIRVGIDSYERVGIQLEEGSGATPYVPYIPSIRGTYQINNNIISYDGGTVRWAKDGEIIERSGNNNLASSYEKRVDVIPDTATRSYGVINYNQAMNTKSKTYMQATISLDSDDGRVFFQLNDGMSNRSWGFIYNLKKGKKYVMEGIYEPREGSTREVTNFGVYHLYDGGSEVARGKTMTLHNAMLVDLTSTFGAGNEPTLEEIQAEPDKWQWLPNPLDLVEAKELKGNILGDMEDTIDDHTRDEQSGVEVFTDKADDSLVRVEIDGKSYQHAGSGKNLVNTKEYSPLSNQVNHEIISMDGRRVSQFRTHFPPTEIDIRNSFKEDTQYTLQFYVKSQSINNITMRFHYTDGTITARALQADYDSWKKYTLSSEPGKTVKEIRTQQGSNGSFSYVDLDTFQLEEGSTATAYEPPAPTPDYPIEIHSLNDFDVVSQKSEGGTIGGIEVGGRNLVKESDLIEHRFVTATPIFRPTKTGIFTISFDYVFLEENELIHSFLYYSMGTRSILGRVPLKEEGEDRAHLTFEVTEDMLGADILIYGGSSSFISRGNSVNFIEVQIERGNLVTDWTPAPEDITSDTDHPLIDKINLSLSEPLRSVDDVKDRLFRDSDGLWKIERNVGYEEIDSNTSMAINKNGIEDYIVINLQRKALNFKDNKSTHVHSVRKNPHADSDENIYFFWHEALRVRLLLGMTLDDYKDFFDGEMAKGIPFTIQYTLADSVIETLDEDLQDKLNNLRSFQDSNYVYTVINN